jgi:uncharacterized protein (TIGR03083 family)
MDEYQTNGNEAPEAWITWMSADDILARAREEREALAQLWQGLSDEQMTGRPGPQPDWSVKDVIAHITWWEQSMVNWVSRALSGEMLARTETPDEINARIHADNRDLPLSDVLTLFDASFPLVEALLERLDDDEINDASVCNIRDMPLLYFIVGNTFAHYADHLEDMRAYVESLSPPQT